jgi:WD40 repeat protein
MKVENPQLLWQLTFEGAWPTAVAFVGGNQRIVAGNQNGQMFLWDLPATPPTFEPVKNSERKAPDLPPIRRLDGHTNGVTRLVVSPDGKTLYSSSLDRTIREWKPDGPAAGSDEAVLDIDQRRSKAKRERKDEYLTAPGVKVETLAPTRMLTGHDDWILSMARDAAGRRLITGDMSARVIVWDLEQFQESTRWSGLTWNWIQSVAMSPDGKAAVVSEHRYKRDDFDIPSAALRVYDATNGQEKLDILKLMFPKYKTDDTSYGGGQIWRKFVAMGLVAADISPSGHLVALGQGGETDTGKVHLIEVESGKLLRSVSGHQYGVTDVKFSADGQYVLSTGRDTTLRITRVDDGKEVAALGAPRGGQFKDWLSALAISPDESLVAASDISGLVQVWRLAGAA